MKYDSDFEADLYCRAYPDVALSGLDPRHHYEKYGRLMGRTPAPKAELWLARPGPADLRAGSGPADLDLLYARGALRHTSPPRHAELVTVIMPSFNNGAWLERAVNSVLSQQGARVELIVIDDGSSDDSVVIARRIAAGFGNMRVISLLRNFGCYYARNIGVMEAQGDYITLLDSDDIMTPDRLARQLDAVKSRSGAVASQSQLRRWTADYKKPLSELKYAENSLLWRRDILDDIGPYDSVRFGGDTEFRMRLQARYGTDAIVRFPDEQYFLRTLEDSLTAQGGSQAYGIQNGKLKLQLSPERKDYVQSFMSWHKAADPLRIEFSQFTRPFAMGARGQNASPTLGQRRVGAVASFPPRREALKTSLESILPQIDEIVLYLNDYEDVPDFTRHPKIRVVRSQEAKGDLRDNGKFYDLPKDDHSYVFTFDDDLIYPLNYTQKMIHNIEMLERSSVVGLHGVVFPEGVRFTKLQQRKVSHFLHAQKGHFVDLLGTGTTAWHSSCLKMDLNDFGGKGVCDLWFAAATAKRGVPLFSVPREADWLKLYKKFEENLYHEVLNQPQGYFDVYNKAVAPAQKKGAVRLAKEAELAELYLPAVLTAAEIELRGNYKG